MYHFYAIPYFSFAQNAALIPHSYYNFYYPEFFSFKDIFLVAITGKKHLLKVGVTVLVSLEKDNTGTMPNQRRDFSGHTRSPILKHLLRSSAAQASNQFTHFFVLLECKNYLNLTVSLSPLSIINKGRISSGDILNDIFLVKIHFAPDICGNLWREWLTFIRISFSIYLAIVAGIKIVCLRSTGWYALVSVSQR